VPAAYARVASVAAASVIVAGVPAPVLAQTETTPQPVIDSAPWRVELRGTATIQGHLEGGPAGTEVKLQRRHPGRRWKVVSVKPVDKNSEVRFRRRYLSTTSDYRIVWDDELTEASASSNVKTIRVRSNLEFLVRPDDVLRSRTVQVRGTLRPARRGRVVRVAHRVKGEWKLVSRVRVRDGRFETAFSTRRVGKRAVRVRFGGDEFNLGDKLRRTLRVYKPAIATWYGPGFYGRRTACGRRLRRDTLGVAHRRLPCGKKVSFLYRGRTITVPVIDRGPYGGPADWDLTSAAAERLRFCCQDTIGVLR
jgi:rare lipoprotein A